MNLSRYADILEERGLVPFQREPWINPETDEPDPRVLGERLPFRWRVSRDEWDRLVAGSTAMFGPVDVDMEQQLGGWVVTADDALAPGTIIFEPLSAPETD